MSGEIKPTADVGRALYNGVGADKVGKGSEAAVGHGRQTDTVAGTDSVYLTDRAQRLQRLGEELASVPAVDSSRVAEIQNKISSGEYQVDAAKIADSMMLEAGMKPGKR